MTSKMTPLACLLSGAAGLLFICCINAARATAACEAELKKGAEQLAEGKFDDALVAFQAALQTLGWTEAVPCGLPWLSLLRLLSSRERNALLCQALTGAARAALLVGRSLEYACAFAGHALSAAQLCDSGAQRALLPVAERTMLDVLLAQSAAHARDGRWRYARSSATSSSRHAADEEALALVRAALETARSGEFNEVIAKAEEALQRTMSAAKLLLWRRALWNTSEPSSCATVGGKAHSMRCWERRTHICNISVSRGRRQWLLT